MKHNHLFALIIFLMYSSLSISAQEETIFESFIFMCIEEQSPTSDSEEAIQKPAILMGFDRTNMLGFILSHHSTITVYAPKTLNTAVGIYNIVTQATSGGYQRDGKLATMYADTYVPVINRPCATEYPDLITEDYKMTLPFPISAEQGLIIQANGDSGLDSRDILGVAAFHLLSSGGSHDFQILQFNANSARLYMPFITSQERFTVIGNKDITIRRSFPEDLDTFSSPFLADILPTFLLTLANEDPSIDLPRIMRNAAFRIYPFSGMLVNYPPGGLFLIEMTDTSAKRNFSNRQGQYVQAIQGDGFLANYYLEFPHLNSPAFGRLEGSQQAEVVEIDERGQLIVDHNNNNNIFIEAWFVEIVGNSP